MMKSGVIIESVAKTVVVNGKNEALVLTIGDYKARPDKSHTPDLPGGQIEIADGESEMIGAIREAEEEAGIVLKPEEMTLAYTKTRSYKDENKSVSFFLYIAHLDYTPEVVISWEHEKYEWVPIDHLLKTKTFRPFYKEGIEYAFDNKLL
ncbi:MAG: NUDIX hydrolase [Candidatus Microsaccharimonas sossegonensis]|uniref:NUDIX hydrolase n=1 Tax=Candidatus Microsaccharimonas sossegonensis TaxID=2506948 RepID=A0A4Q0AJN2_9BACT|nr:MAG: NUDIX hydrolase [Candidatus Microsaccharimonas sossegonensis]